MAVIGRQKPYSYLASQTAMRVSATVMFNSAKSRAFSAKLSPLTLATERATAFKGTCVACFQKFAMLVCSTLRVALSLLPRLWVSRYAVANSGLVIAGGAAGRKCCGVGNANGLTDRQPGSSAAWSSEGVGRHWPGSVLPG